MLPVDPLLTVSLQSVLLLQKGQSVVSRCRDHISPPLRLLNTHLRADRLHDRPVTHGLYNAGCPQNRNAADNPQLGIKGLLRNRFSVRSADHNMKPFGSIPHILPFVQYFDHVFSDHLSGNTVDRSLSHRLIQSRFGHTADTNSSLNGNPRLITPRDLCHNPRAGRDIRIVAAIL